MLLTLASDSGMQYLSAAKVPVAHESNRPSAQQYCGSLLKLSGLGSPDHILCLRTATYLVTSLRSALRCGKSKRNAFNPAGAGKRNALHGAGISMV